MIQIPTALKARLRECVAAIEAAEAERSEAEGRVNAAAEVETGLRARIAEIEAEMQAPFVQPDADRVARLLSGDNPATLDAEEIASRALRTTHLAAEREQLRADADAVAARLAELREPIAGIERRIDQHRRELARVFADGALATWCDGMRGAAQKLLPLLHLAGAVEQALTGRQRTAIGMNLGGLQLKLWHAENGNWREEQIWPRRDRFADGEPISVPDPTGVLLALLRE